MYAMDSPPRLVDLSTSDATTMSWVRLILPRNSKSSSASTVGYGFILCWTVEDTSSSWILPASYFPEAIIVQRNIIL